MLSSSQAADADRKQALLCAHAGPRAPSGAAPGRPQPGAENPKALLRDLSEPARDRERLAADQIAELCDRFGCSDHRRAQIDSLLRLLQGDPHAPTSVTDPRAALQMHFADSLAALEIEGVSTAASLVDIGSGAGFPGIALAMWLPHAHVHLVESRGTRCAFLRRALACAQVSNATVVHTRAEQWREGLGVNHLAVARAVGPQPAVLEYAAPLLAVGGLLVDWRGRRELQEEQQTLCAADQLRLTRVDVRRVQPFPSAKDRHLHVFQKVEETPPRFPRRPGVALKRPLRADRGGL